MSNDAQLIQSPREYVVEVLAITLLDMLLLGRGPSSAQPTLEPDDANTVPQPGRGRR